ncbi:MAG: hypothetical protein JWR69_2296 [Pedosphaera sp.]|nr:hypothetical protein [Pedosphaera sp.]
MKMRWTILLGLATAVAISAFLLLRRGGSEQKAVEETRRTLREQGYKVELSEFNFSTSAELRDCAAALTTLQRTLSSAPFRETLELMAPVRSDAALVVWKQETLADSSGADLWPVQRQAFNQNRSALDAACQAALSGPIRFDLNASAGSAILLPHLATVKNLVQTLGRRAILELHDGHKDAAWTNLLASTRLVTAWEPESIEVSHLVRLACAAIAFDATWQALQADGWRDERLAELQHEWESVEFLKSLPETAAFNRASMVAMCQLERLQPPSPGISAKEMLHSPRYAWAGLTESWQKFRYRQHGTYEDEKNLLLHYRDREAELRRAVQSSTWVEMRPLPGVTNRVLFQSKHHSAMQAILNLKTMSLGWQAQGQGLLARAAEAETRRRLVITAIALERFRNRHGSYPKALPELLPELLQATPIDFMDGKPLRYHLAEDGHFVLYSIGLDGTDNGGQMPPAWEPGMPYQGRFGVAQGTDLVWPRPASAAEIEWWAADKARLAKFRKTAQEEYQAIDDRRAEALRQATVQKLLAGEQARQSARPSSGTGSKEPMYQGQPLSKVLRNEKVSGKTPLTLDELLTVKQIITGAEPNLATFELPISYDVVTNLGDLHLLVDVGSEKGSTRRGGELQDCERATNGNCLLVWNNTYDPPGQHAVQAQLRGWAKPPNTFEVKGPVVPFLSTNICQFDPFYAEFGSNGGILYAKLPETNGIYTIELKSPAEEHIRTFTGTTSNGVINVDWDGKDDQGHKYTGDSLRSVFQVTLPDSGRSQTQKGP